MSVNIEERKKWNLKPGNTVKVWVKIQEKGKTRLQVFEGVILAHKHGFEQGATFTVRKVASGVGVEKIFPVLSPNIEKIEITKKAKVRRSKLYYVREKSAKQIRKKVKRIQEAFVKAVKGEKAPVKEREDKKEGVEEIKEEPNVGEVKPEVIEAEVVETTEDVEAEEKVTDAETEEVKK